MKEKIKLIDAGGQDMSRPKDRPPKTNWQVELLKKGLFTLQHISPRKTSEIIWHQFTKPGQAKFTPAQQSLIEKAEITHLSYLGHKVVHYRWGNKGPKVLFSHGWRSKTVDFRRMIEALVEQGFVVEGVDMKAHGQSEGKRTALPEFRDILKNHYVKNGPYHAVIGYSLGGLAAGLVLSEVTPAIHPKHMILIAAPPYVRYFFYDTIKELGYKKEVYEEMCELVEKNYKQKVDYFDLRDKSDFLNQIRCHLIYDENDATVPFKRGKEVNAVFTDASFVHTRGLGHYKIITHPDVISYVTESLMPIQSAIHSIDNE